MLPTATGMLDRDPDPRDRWSQIRDLVERSLRVPQDTRNYFIESECRDVGLPIARWVQTVADRLSDCYRLPHAWTAAEAISHPLADFRIEVERSSHLPPRHRPRLRALVLAMVDLRRALAVQGITGGLTLTEPADEFDLWTRESAIQEYMEAHERPPRPDPFKQCIANKRVHEHTVEEMARSRPVGSSGSRVSPGIRIARGIVLLPFSLCTLTVLAIPIVVLAMICRLAGISWNSTEAMFPSRGHTIGWRVLDVLSLGPILLVFAPFHAIVVAFGWAFSEDPFRRAGRGS